MTTHLITAEIDLQETPAQLFSCSLEAETHKKTMRTATLGSYRCKCRTAESCTVEAVVTLNLKFFRPSVNQRPHKLFYQPPLAERRLGVMQEMHYSCQSRSPSQTARLLPPNVLTKLQLYWLSCPILMKAMVSTSLQHCGAAPSIKP